MKYYWKIHTHTHTRKSWKENKNKVQKTTDMFLNSSQNKSGKFQAKQTKKSILYAGK